MALNAEAVMQAAFGLFGIQIRNYAKKKGAHFLEAV